MATVKYVNNSPYVDKRANKWQFEEMMVLINGVDKRKHIVLTRDKQVTNEAKRDAWQEISEEVATVGSKESAIRSYVQCENKWTQLKKSALRRKQAYTNRKKRMRASTNNSDIFDNDKAYSHGALLSPSFPQMFGDNDESNNGTISNENTQLLEALVEGQREMSDKLEKVCNAQLQILEYLKSKAD